MVWQDRKRVKKDHKIVYTDRMVSNMIFTYKTSFQEKLVTYMLSEGSPAVHTYDGYHGFVFFFTTFFFACLMYVALTLN